jgi:leader peptidase (prepilin peptidase) / N-methyltransferase
MDIYIGAFIFIFGLLFGSFFNVCIYRIPREESIAYPPSHCTSCSTRLRPLDLVPVLSYLFLGRKCRYCGEKISSRYAIIETLTGVIFLLIYLRYGLTYETLKYIVLACFLIVIGMIDLDTTDVYSVTTYSGIAVGIVSIAAGYYLGYEVKTFVLGAVLAGGVIAAIILLTRGMGWGDFEICLMSGLYIGFKNSIVMLMISFIVGALFGIFLIVAKKKTRKDYIPFGPYISLASIITILVGENIIQWYLSFTI